MSFRRFNSKWMDGLLSNRACLFEIAICLLVFSWCFHFTVLFIVVAFAFAIAFLMFLRRFLRQTIVCVCVCAFYILVEFIILDFDDECIFENQIKEKKTTRRGETKRNEANVTYTRERAVMQTDGGES